MAQLFLDSHFPYPGFSNQIMLHIIQEEKLLVFFCTRDPKVKSYSSALIEILEISDFFRFFFFGNSARRHVHCR